MSDFSWVTLATNDTYGLGVLVVAHSLKRTNTVHKIVALITNSVTQSMRDKLQNVCDEIVLVETLISKDEANLSLLNRPELCITLSKLHCWNLIQYKKCVFLDADVLVLKNCDELFDYEEFSAAPDVGWPDCFNSGVFVFEPSVETFKSLKEFASKETSFDGADQGLLNSYFSNWAHGDIKKHLPFTYNTCSTATYSYLPAFKQFRDKVKIMHFIGKNKPWIQFFDSKSYKVYPVNEMDYLTDYFQLWWDIFRENVLSHLDSSMNTKNNNTLKERMCQKQACFHYLQDQHSSRSSHQISNYFTRNYEKNRSSIESIPNDFNINPNYCSNISAKKSACNYNFDNNKSITNVIKKVVNDFNQLGNVLTQCSTNSSTNGVAGSLSQIKLGEENAINARYLENLHRENWESGRIDYMGKDSFDNIWSRICSTLSKDDDKKN